MAHELPKLNYDYSSLEPYIDAKTMEIHHSKHHAAYVNKLNTALEKHPDLADRSIESLLKNLDKVPEDIRTAVRNNGGGHYNHALFWSVMGPDSGGGPQGKLLTAIDASFGSFERFKEKFVAGCRYPIRQRMGMAER